MGGTPSPILNQCLEEAVARLLGLTQWMADTGEVVDGIGEAAHALDEAAASEDATHLHDAFVEAASTADRIGQELDVEEEAAIASLPDLGQQATETAAALDRVLSSVRRHAGQLAEVRGQIVGKLDAVLDSSREGFAQLAQSVAAYQAALEAALTQVEELWQGLQGAVTDAHDGLQEKHDQWNDALGRVATAALDTTRAVASGVQESGGALGREVVELANAVIDHHNTAVLALRRGFTDEDPSGTGAAGPWLQTLTAPLAAAVQDVDGAGGAIEAARAAEVQELTQLDLAGVRAANRIADLVARVAPALP